MSVRSKYLLGSLALVVCAIALLLAYRWYQSQYLRPFDGRAEVFSGDELRLPAPHTGPGLVRVVHFWDPACPCNVGNQQHLAQLIERFAPLGVEFFVVQKPGSQGQLPAPLAALKPLPGLEGSASLPASPAVAIWNSAGELIYLGPYSEGAVCSSANSFVEPILEGVLAGREIRATHSMAVACFCDWHD